MSHYSIASKVNAIKDYAWSNGYGSIRVFILNEMFDHDETAILNFVRDELLGSLPTYASVWDFIFRADDGILVTVPVSDDYADLNPLPGTLYV